MEDPHFATYASIACPAGNSQNGAQSCVPKVYYAEINIEVVKSIMCMVVAAEKETSGSLSEILTKLQGIFRSSLSERFQCLYVFLSHGIHLHP